MELIGFTFAIVIGVLLGLIGGGGSILTVPVLFYLFHLDTDTASAYSLFIVGTSSLIGVIQKYKEGLVHLKTALIFGVPSILGVLFTRTIIVPSIPNEIFTIGSFVLTKSILTMTVFAILMVIASVSMIRNKKEASESLSNEQIFNYPLILIEGLVVGILTGFVGAGGGFLIIPALVFLSKLPMKMAIGTSLLIIAAKSLIGFSGDVYVRLHSTSNAEINWNLLLIFTLLAVGGIFIGNNLSKKIDGSKLKIGFGWLVLVMGIYIIISELVK